MALFGGLGKLLGKGLKLVSPQISGVVGRAGGLVSRIGKKNLKRAVIGAAAGTAVAVKRFARTPGGKMVMVGGGGAALGAGAAAMMGGQREFRRYRRINPGNTRAMRRAIRRIEAGARIYSKFFGMKRGRIKGAPGVHVKKLSIRRAA